MAVTEWSAYTLSFLSHEAKSGHLRVFPARLAHTTATSCNGLFDGFLAAFKRALNGEGGFRGSKVRGPYLQLRAENVAADVEELVHDLHGRAEGVQGPRLLREHLHNNFIYFINPISN